MRRNTGFKTSLTGLSYRGESNDMHHVCLGQVMTLTLGQSFNLTFRGYIIYHLTRLDERNILVIDYNPNYIMSEIMLKKLFEAKLSIFTFHGPWRSNH